MMMMMSCERGAHAAVGISRRTLNVQVRASTSSLVVYLVINPLAIKLHAVQQTYAQEPPLFKR